MPTEEELAIIAEMEAQYSGKGEEAAFGDIGTRPEQEQLPKAKYGFKILNAFLNRSQSSNRKQFSAECVVIESKVGDELVGKKYRKNWGLETSENLEWFNTDLSHLELTAPAKPADYLVLQNTMIGICFNGSIVPNDDIAFPPNCYINRGARRQDLEETNAAKASF